MHVIRTTRLKFFGHITHTDPSMNDSSDPVWPPYQGNRTVDQADLVKLDSAQLNLMLLTQHWSGNCLSLSTKSTGMEVARRNGNALPHDDDDEGNTIITIMVRFWRLVPHGVTVEWKSSWLNKTVS